jgi:hypothetical protein
MTGTEVVEERLRATYAILASRTRCDVEDPSLAVVATVVTRRHPRRRTAAVIAAVFVILCGAAVAVSVVRDDNGTQVATAPTTARKPIDLDRTRLPLPDDSLGWMAYRATRSPITDGASLEESQRVMNKFRRTLFPVTRRENPASRRIGYYLPFIGFLPAATVEDPAFDVEAVIAHGPCTPPAEMTLANGSYDCVSTAGHKPRGTSPAP